MAYITTTQLSERLGTPLYARLTDRVSGTAADATVAQRIIEEAEAEANAYLARRYAVPIDLGARPELAGVLAARVLDLAEFMAWKSSPFVNGLPLRVSTVYRAAQLWFQSVADGTLSLPAAGVPASQVSMFSAPQSTSTPRAFTPDELDGL